jgi:hypothetical protein
MEFPSLKSWFEEDDHYPFIVALHRGFSPFERTLYRNMPKWNLLLLKG